MFRQVSWLVGAIALIAVIRYLPSASRAEDVVKPVPQTKAKKPSNNPPTSGVTQSHTRRAHQAVTDALVWLANHQSADGSWSLHDYTKQCKDKTCTGQCDISSEAGATALGLLPYLAASQTHKSRGAYKEHVRMGIDWLIRHQQPDGNLAKGSAQMMYGHGLAAIALSEDYGLTGDKSIGKAAQAAVNFILKAQNANDGGWRYNPQDRGDTCVLGWQLTALKTARMAGLDVGEEVFKGATKYLDSVAIRDGTEYGYQPGMESSPTITAVGLLGRQYLGARRDNPMLVGGVKYLINHLPDEARPNIYYWYYGTQFMHNMNGYEWDTWNRKTHDLLLRTQVLDDSCARGSWDPAKDAWGKQGGRVMETSLSTLCLEVYFQWHTQIFRVDPKLDKEADNVDKVVNIGEGDVTQPAKPADDKPSSPMTPGSGAKTGGILSAATDPSAGTAVTPGAGSSFGGFGGRGSRSRPILVEGGGGNMESERAVTAGLVWLANHQLSDGSWNFAKHNQRCTDKTCTGSGLVARCEAGATALGLLPFLAAGQTHKSKGPYKEHILRALEWLLRHQTPDGNLAKGAQQMMYSHGLATTALCEAYGLTGDKYVGMHAQAAINFILKAQNQADGGWRYNPGDPGDTSVTGWQLMALKSGHMAGLDVGGSVFSGTSKWLDAVAVHDGAEYGYQPGQSSSNTMTAVGLLCRQYLGVKRDNPMLSGGTKYLLNHLPDEGFSNLYYWYYATQVVHNMGGDEWDAWNRKMRDLLIRTQVRNVDQCANGSWSPERDTWGKYGGRVMQTSLSVLTLEIYYRYLPLYKR